MRRLLIALTSVVCACSPASIHGQIDGDPVAGARSAIFDTIDLDFGVLGSIEQLVIILTSVPDACEALDDLYSISELGCDDICDEIVDMGEDYSFNQDEYYTITIVANTEDGEEGEFDFDDKLQDEEFTADYFAFDATAFQDSDECEDQCEDGDLLDGDLEDGDDGVLTIKKSDGDVVAGKFEIEFGSDELKGSFRATECNMSDWLPGA